MKRRFLTILTVLLLTLSITAVPVLAAEGSGNTLFDDSVGLLSEEESNALETSLRDISKEQKCEVSIVVVNSLDGKSATAFADDFFDYNNYGWGKSKDGIMLVISMGSRDWAITTHGMAIEAFTDAGQKYIIDQMSDALSEDDFATAFNQFASLSDDFLTQYYSGDPYDVDNLPGEKKGIHIVIDIIAGLVIGILIALFAVGRDKAALKTVRRESAARNYLVKGSLRVTRDYEKFLYCHVDRVKRESDSGGSSTHTSSSGEIHGGSSGKF